MVTKKLILKLPQSPGIYIFKDKTDKIIYVGKSVSIKKRVSSYFAKSVIGAKTQLMVSKISKVEFIKVFSEFEALLLEAELIKKHKPFFNIQAKDDKSPIYIVIANTQVPLITTARKPQVKKGDFVKGPFPSAKTTREVLKIIRKIFPYCHHKNPKKPCLYVHLGLCPYPYKDDQSKEKYKKSIEKIKRLLSSKNKILAKDLVREMKLRAQNMEFEEAQELKKQIEKIQQIHAVYHAPQEFLEVPTLVDDLTMTRLTDLKKKLNLKKVPRRIECFDISNLGGKQATGSMVTFTNGEANKQEYRRFRIKFTDKIDDYEMIREVITRRLKNKWPLPDLIIIDGGRGQLNAALSAMSRLKVQIPIVSLAKRLEEIYSPQRILPLQLPKESPARQLAQSLRDEAHRFALYYHRLLRSKNLLKDKH